MCTPPHFTDSNSQTDLWCTCPQSFPTISTCYLNDACAVLPRYKNAPGKYQQLPQTRKLVIVRQQDFIHTWKSTWKLNRKPTCVAVCTALCIATGAEHIKMCFWFGWRPLYIVKHVRGCELNTEKVPSTANSWLRWRTPLCGPMVNILSYSSANKQRSCMVLCDCVIYSFVHLTYCTELHV
jgi:hypothetical protein